MHPVCFLDIQWICYKELIGSRKSATMADKKHEGFEAISEFESEIFWVEAMILPQT